MAQVCKFYASGQCRYGRNCRYIHPGETTTATSGSSSGNNAFGSARSTGFVGGGGGGGAQTKLGDGFNLPTEESIRIDLTERPIWFLSSYAPGKDPPAQLIDGKDISPEEARVMAYKSGAEGNPVAYEVEWNRLTSQAEAQIRNILSDLPGAVHFMRGAYENRANSRYNSRNTTASAFGSISSQSTQFGISEQSTSPFVQPQQSATFGKPSQPVSAYGQQSQPASAFSGALPFPVRSTPAFGQSAFGQTPAAPSYGQTAFSQAQLPQPQSNFGQPVFGKSSLAKPTFGQPAFGQSAFGQSSVSAQAPTFGQSTSQQPTSAFSQPPPFGTQNVPQPAFSQPSFSQSPFAQGSPFATNASASQAQQHVPGASSVFGSTTNQNTAITPNAFQQASQNTTAQNTPSPFSNLNLFQQGQQAVSNQFQQTAEAGPAQPVTAFSQHDALVSTFGTPQHEGSPFSNVNTFQLSQQKLVGHQVNPQLREQQKAKKWDDPVIKYIQVERDAFAAPAFQLGCVPTVAPSRDMCWG